jgi:hypothetical protein
MPDDTMRDVLLRYPPRDLAPHERQLVHDWLALAADVPAAFVSERRSDDPALYRRVVISVEPNAQPTHLIHAPTGMRLWVKVTVAADMRIEMFDSLASALNSIRSVLV